MNINPFERWVLSRYPAEPISDGPPDDWDRANEFFYMIDDSQYRIPIADVPKKFEDVIATARVTGSVATKLR